MAVAYIGPKAFLPAELDRAGHIVPVSRALPPAQASCAEWSLLKARLCEMGFTEGAATEALAEVDARGVESDARLQAAIDHLMAASSDASCAAGAAPAVPEEACECSICCEDMELASAAMRCSGQHGKRHYYHAQCLSQWIQQCRRENLPPTCPECRGELQVRAQRLGDFLADKAGKLNHDDVEALRAVHNAAMAESDGDGWSGIQTDTVLKGIAVSAGVAVAGLAIAAAIGAFSQNKRDDRSRR